MPNRVIRDTRDSDAVNGLSLAAELFFYRCFMEADDYGVLRAQPTLLKSLLYPTKETVQLTTGGPKIPITVDMVKAWLGECITQNLIKGYRVKEKPYIQILNFGQTKDRMIKTHPWPGEESDVSGDQSLAQGADHTRKGNKKEKRKGEKESNIPPLVIEVIDFLNLTCKTQYKSNSQKSISLITARLRENFTLDDFKKVIIHKNTTWASDHKMHEYLRPETLFGGKFEGYLQAAQHIVVTKEAEQKEGKVDAVKLAIMSATEKMNKQNGNSTH